MVVVTVSVLENVQIVSSTVQISCKLALPLRGFHRGGMVQAKIEFPSVRKSSNAADRFVSVFAVMRSSAWNAP